MSQRVNAHGEARSGGDESMPRRPDDEPSARRAPKPDSEPGARRCCPGSLEAGLVAVIFSTFKNQVSLASTHTPSEFLGLVD
jgi:hypothetical protein